MAAPKATALVVVDNTYVLIDYLRDQPAAVAVLEAGRTPWRCRW